MIDSTTLKWLCVGFVLIGLARILAAQQGYVIP